MNTNRCMRRLFACLGLFCLSYLAGALYLQYVEHQAPCPLCILQRYAYLMIALFAFCIAMVPVAWIKKVSVALILVTSFFGAAVAARQLWLLSHPVLNCGFDALQPIVDRLPLAYIIPEAFKAWTACDTHYSPVFGLPLPAWSLLGLIGIFLWTIWVTKKCPYCKIPD